MRGEDDPYILLTLANPYGAKSKLKDQHEK